MTALLMTTVVASSSQTGFSALLPREREGRPVAVDLSTTSRSSFGIESVSGSGSHSGGLKTGRGARSFSVNYENSSGSISGLRAIPKDSGGYSSLSSKLPNDVNHAASSMATFSKTPEEYYSTMVTDVIENVEFERMTLNETKHAKQTKHYQQTKHEVRTPGVPHSEHDVSRIPRLDSTHLEMEAPTKPVSVKDYMDLAPGYVQDSDTGPPRWFCPVDTAGFPPDAPILLFLPGMDSTGLGLLLHQKQLARIFEVQILHTPISDRTDFDGLMEIVEKRIRDEYNRKPVPIYVLAESFGGCLALSVAARNPDLDIVLVIANPGSSLSLSSQTGQCVCLLVAIQILLDSNDLLSIPVANEYLRQNASQFPAARTTGTGEVTKEVFITPVGYLKSPPRFYFLFKQPISTEGMLDSINDRAVTDQLYRKVRTDVESGLLVEKRSEDPYRDFLPRVLYEATNKRQAPTFNL